MGSNACAGSSPAPSTNLNHYHIDSDFLFFLLTSIYIKTAITFATSDREKLRTIISFIESLEVPIINIEELPPIEITPQLAQYLEKIESRNTPFEECEDFDVMINEVATEYRIELDKTIL